MGPCDVFARIKSVQEKASILWSENGVKPWFLAMVFSPKWWPWNHGDFFLGIMMINIGLTSGWKEWWNEIPHMILNSALDFIDRPWNFCRETFKSLEPSCPSQGFYSAVDSADSDGSADSADWDGSAGREISGPRVPVKGRFSPKVVRRILAWRVMEAMPSPMRQGTGWYRVQPMPGFRRNLESFIVDHRWSSFIRLSTSQTHHSVRSISKSELVRVFHTFRTPFNVPKLGPHNPL